MSYDYWNNWSGYMTEREQALPDSDLGELATYMHKYTEGLWYVYDSNWCNICSGTLPEHDDECPIPSMLTLLGDNERSA